MCSYLVKVLTKVYRYPETPDFNENERDANYCQTSSYYHQSSMNLK